MTAVDTNVASTTTTNSAGYCRVVDLVPGKYRIRFVAAGLKLGTVIEHVQVTAEVPLLKTAASNFSTRTA